MTDDFFGADVTPAVAFGADEFAAGFDWNELPVEAIHADEGRQTADAFFGDHDTPATTWLPTVVASSMQQQQSIISVEPLQSLEADVQRRSSTDHSVVDVPTVVPGFTRAPPVPLLRRSDNLGSREDVSSLKKMIDALAKSPQQENVAFASTEVESVHEAAEASASEVLEMSAELMTSLVDLAEVLGSSATLATVGFEGVALAHLNEALIAELRAFN